VSRAVSIWIGVYTVTKYERRRREGAVHGAPHVAFASVDQFERIAPIFPVRDLEIALAHYARLGFKVRRYAGNAAYGFAEAGDVEIHLGVPSADEHGRASAYLFVADADAVAATWTAAGVDVRPPQDTEWGKREGAVVDPDGNVIRFGSDLAAKHVP
jgi:catechol 2,3-dioxygenase-like lactoylglutathione lyase family enzyme